MVISVDLDGGPADPGCGRLVGALDVRLEAPPLPEAARAVPLPAVVTAIDRRIGFDRLGAAREADIELEAVTAEARKRPGNPGVAERLTAVLGVWASTRHALGLNRAARKAMEQAQAWAGRDPASSLYAFTVERSAHILTEAGVVSWLEHALTVHLTTAGSGPAVTRCLMQLAEALAEKQEERRARVILEAVQDVLTEEECPELFEARLRLAQLHLKAQRLDGAAELLAALPQGPSLPLQCRALSTQADLAEAEGSLPNAVRFRVAAVELASEICGPEIVLEELLAAATLSRQLSTSFDSDDEDRLIHAVLGLRKLSDKQSWGRSIRRLARAVISGKPVEGAEPETLRAELLSLQQEALAADLPEPKRALVV